MNIDYCVRVFYTVHREKNKTLIELQIPLQSEFNCHLPGWRHFGSTFCDELSVLAFFLFIWYRSTIVEGRKSNLTCLPFSSECHPALSRSSEDKSLIWSTPTDPGLTGQLFQWWWSDFTFDHSRNRDKGPTVVMRLNVTRGVWRGEGGVFKSPCPIRGSGHAPR